MKKAQFVLIVVLTLFIFLNLKITTGIIIRGQKVLDSSDNFPGTPFLFLKPFLAHVFQAGYYDDHTPANPDINPLYARNFQTAQFALAPAFLTMRNPGLRFVIVHLSSAQALASIIKQWPSRVIAFNGFDIALIRRFN